MSQSRRRTMAVAVVIPVLLLAGFWQAGSGLWIYGKAYLAQVLLQRAWARSLAGETGAKPWPWADTWPVARLVVPSQGIDQIVLEGAYGRTLAFGPGHLESSDRLEESHRIILTGHRDTHFRFLEHLQPGESILLQTQAGVWDRFTIHDREIVDSRTALIHGGKEDRTLILVTCYPFHALRPNTPWRYIVTASGEETGMEGDADAKPN